MIVDD